MKITKSDITKIAGHLFQVLSKKDIQEEGINKKHTDAVCLIIKDLEIPEKVDVLSEAFKSFYPGARPSHLFSMISEIISYELEGGYKK